MSTCIIFQKTRKILHIFYVFFFVVAIQCILIIEKKSMYLLILFKRHEYWLKPKCSTHVASIVLLVHFMRMSIDQCCILFFGLMQYPALLHIVRKQKWLLKWMMLLFFKWKFRNKWYYLQESDFYKRRFLQEKAASISTQQKSIRKEMRDFFLENQRIK